ncbi:hypothetical protein NPIL_694271 [Nephila pilipes]|uniref:Uncharacterized protein n=1 Tax=Nephila pilipes TaxID=299642 RepID=A0A8X6U9S6_NEPPI|nr:hypothetical protein NPIL_694271 [Nephila pilipes]
MHTWPGYSSRVQLYGRPGKKLYTDRRGGNSVVLGQYRVSKVMLRICKRKDCNISKIPMPHSSSSKASEHFRNAVTNSPSQISEKGVLVLATLVDLKKRKRFQSEF